MRSGHGSRLQGGFAAAALFALAASPPAQAQDASQPIGAVQKVIVWGFSTPPGKGRRDVFERTNVVRNEVIETGKDMGVHVRFNDGTIFRVGENSQAKLDQFVHTPGALRGEMAVTMSRGVFRYITGIMGGDGVKLGTPATIIGVRGTNVLLNVATDGTTTVAPKEGQGVAGDIVIPTGFMMTIPPNCFDMRQDRCRTAVVRQPDHSFPFETRTVEEWRPPDLGGQNNDNNNQPVLEHSYY